MTPASHDVKPPSNTGAATQRALAIALVILLAAVLANLPALWATFTWDDELHLLEHPVIRPGGLWHVWFQPGYGMYWPVTFTTYWIEFQLFGLSPLVYHTTNLLIHGLNAVLVWRVARRLEVPWPWMVGLLFAVHPVNVETAAWVAQRKGLVCMVLACLSTLAYLRYVEHRQWKDHLSAAVLFLLSMLSKGASVSLPGALLVMVWWKKGKLTWRDLLDLWPMALVAAGMSASEYLNHVKGMIADNPVRPEGLTQVATGFGWIIWFYFYKALLPIQLSFVYPRWTFNPTIPLHHVPNLALAGVLGTLAWKQGTRWGRAALTAALVYGLLILPAAGFIKFGFLMYSWVGDHYQYFALPAVISLGVAAVHDLSHRWRPLRHAAPALAAAVMLVLGSLSYLQASLYRNPETLWLDTLAKNPQGWIAWHNTGAAYLEQNRFGDATQAFERAATLANHPDNRARTANNLGMIALKMGRIEEAQRQYQIGSQALHKTVRLHAINGLATTFLRMGNLTEADRLCSEAVSQADTSKVHSLLLATLAEIRARQNRMTEAQTALNMAIIEQPDDRATLLANFGITLLEIGNTRDGRACLEAALLADPRSTVALQNLAVLDAMAGDLPRAQQGFTQVLALDPSNFDATLSLARIALLQQRFDEAITRAQSALKLRPVPAAYVILGQALEAQGLAAQALKAYESALELAPRDAQAAAGAQRLRAKLPK